jgi:hypothetical protein
MEKISSAGCREEEIVEDGTERGVTTWPMNHP